MKEIKVFELFSGIGAQATALENIGTNFNIIGISEIDKDAIKAYYAIHNTINPKNYGDIREIDNPPECNLLTYSFPCTDISLAGRQAGMEGTRSGLLWEVGRLLSIYKESQNLPDFLVMENVPQLINKKFKKYFNKWIEILNSYGYKTTYKILNAKDFGIPQDRQRLFAVSTLSDKIELNFEKRECQNLESFLKNFDEVEPYARSLTQFYSKNILENLPNKNETYIINNEYPNSRLPYFKKYCYTIRTTNGRNIGYYNGKEQKLRGLDSEELFWLMGFDSEQYNRIKDIPMTKKNKLIGNSICVPILEEIFKKIIIQWNKDQEEN